MRVTLGSRDRPASQVRPAKAVGASYAWPVFASLGRFVYRRRVPVALAWVLVLGVGIGVGGEVFGRLGTGSGLRDDAESVVVADLLGRVAGGGPAAGAARGGRA